MDLSGKVAVITGGASGIGLATAKALAERGCRLVVGDVEASALDQAVADLAVVTDVLGLHIDVSVKADVDRLAEEADRQFGGADIVFLNAGVGSTAPLLATTHDDWRWVVGVNLWGVIHGVEAFLPRVVASGRGGHFVFTSSFAGLVPNDSMGPYCVTKYGVVALAEVLHREMRGTDIGVSVLCPMLVATNVGSAARNRPLELGGPDGLPSGDHTADPNLAGSVLGADEVGALVVAAIGTDQLYVFTHGEAQQFIRRRFARIDDAFGGTAGNKRERVL